MTEETGRVTRSLRKRIASVDQDHSSRPGTPINAKQLVTETSPPARPARMTRRNSTSGNNTPAKTPAKTRGVAAALASAVLSTPEVNSPARRTRRRSTSITEEEPAKTIAKPHFDTLQEEDANLDDGETRRITRLQSKSPSLPKSSPKPLKASSEMAQSLSKALSAVKSPSVPSSPAGRKSFNKPGPKSRTRARGQTFDVDNEVEIIQLDSEPDELPVALKNTPKTDGSIELLNADSNMAGKGAEAKTEDVVVNKSPSLQEPTAELEKKIKIEKTDEKEGNTSQIVITEVRTLQTLTPATLSKMNNTDVSPDNKTQGRLVGFNASPDIGKARITYPKTPAIVKSKSYIDGDSSKDNIDSMEGSIIEKSVNNERGSEASFKSAENDVVTETVIPETQRNESLAEMRMEQSKESIDFHETTNGHDEEEMPFVKEVVTDADPLLLDTKTPFRAQMRASLKSSTPLVEASPSEKSGLDIKPLPMKEPDTDEDEDAAKEEQKNTEEKAVSEVETTAEALLAKTPKKGDAGEGETINESITQEKPPGGEGAGGDASPAGGKSWMQTIRVEVMKNGKIDTIAQEEKNAENDNEKASSPTIVAPKKRRSYTVAIDADDDEDMERLVEERLEDEEQEEELAEDERPYRKHAFVDDEAMEVDEDYRSGDSMSESERREMEENEISVDGESLGSEDTDQEEQEDDDEDNDNGSFIVSDNSDHELLLEYSNDEELDESMDSNSTKKKKKKGGYKRIQMIDSDSDAEHETAVEKSKADAEQQLTHQQEQAKETNKEKSFVADDQPETEGEEENKNKRRSSKGCATATDDSQRGVNCNTLNSSKQNAQEAADDEAADAATANTSKSKRKSLKSEQQSQEKVENNSTDNDDTSKLSESALRLQQSVESESTGDEVSMRLLNASRKKILNKLNQSDRFNKTVQDLDTIEHEPDETSADTIEGASAVSFKSSRRESSSKKSRKSLESSCGEKADDTEIQEEVVASSDGDGRAEQNEPENKQMRRSSTRLSIKQNAEDVSAIGNQDAHEEEERGKKPTKSERKSLNSSRKKNVSRQQNVEVEDEEEEEEENDAKEVEEEEEYEQEEKSLKQSAKKLRNRSVSFVNRSGEDENGSAAEENKDAEEDCGDGEGEKDEKDEVDDDEGENEEDDDDGEKEDDDDDDDDDDGEVDEEEEEEEDDDDGDGDTKSKNKQRLGLSVSFSHSRQKQRNSLAGQAMHNSFSLGSASTSSTAHKRGRLNRHQPNEEQIEVEFNNGAEEEDDDNERADQEEEQESTSSEDERSKEIGAVEQELEKLKKIEVVSKYLANERRKSLALPVTTGQDDDMSTYSSKKLKRKSMGLPVHDDDFNPSQSLVETIEERKHDLLRNVKRKRLSKSFSGVVGEDGAGGSNALNDTAIDYEVQHLHKKSKLADEEDAHIESSTPYRRGCDDEPTTSSASSTVATASTGAVKQKSMHVDNNNVQKILSRCEEILDRANRAKLEAKLNFNKSKVRVQKKKRKQQHKSTKESATTSTDEAGALSEPTAPTVHNKRKAIEHALKTAVGILTEKKGTGKKQQQPTHSHKTTDEDEDEDEGDEPMVQQQQHESKRIRIEVVEAMAAKESEPVTISKNKKKEGVVVVAATGTGAAAESSLFSDLENNLQSAQQQSMKKKKNMTGAALVMSNAAGAVLEAPATPKSKKKPKVKKLQLSSGVMCEEPLTPVKATSSTKGFRESPITPKTLGFKVRQILTAGQDTPPSVPSSSAKQTRKRKRRIEEPQRTLPKPQWTKSGVFMEENVPGSGNSQTAGATQFAVAALKSKRKANMKTPFSVANANAINFKNTALFSSNIQRESSHEVLQRRERRMVNSQF